MKKRIGAIMVGIGLILAPTLIACDSMPQQCGQYDD